MFHNKFLFDPQKEASSLVKLRNDNNVVVKIERTSSLIKRLSSDSVKENRLPESIEDEGIQSARESEVSAKNSKRSNSVEVISAKLVEIDITSSDDVGNKMPPPQVPRKMSKKQRPKLVEDEVAAAVGSLRITRSKIKKEKVSTLADEPVAEASSSNKTKIVDTTVSKKAKVRTAITTSVTKQRINDSFCQQRYPMPILIKLEKTATDDQEPQHETPEECAASDPNCNATFDIEPTVIGTVAIAPAQTSPPNPNATVTLSQNPHDSLMTEDNDDDGAESLKDLPPPLPAKKKTPQVPVIPLKKHEVFK